jgi:auxin efflux carrier family protein
MSTEEGGFFNAWLTSSLLSIGKLFVSLQVVVFGVSLGLPLRKMKRGETSGSIPWILSLFVLVVRFMIWPVISISVIWTIATKTSWLGDDLSSVHNDAHANRVYSYETGRNGGLQ